MSALLLHEIKKLREEVDVLRAVNAELRAQLAPRLRFPPHWQLTPQERAVLETLYKSRGWGASHERLIASIYPKGADHVADPVGNLKVVVSRLRRQTPPPIEIENDYGTGYRLTHEAVAYLAKQVGEQ